MDRNLRFPLLDLFEEVFENWKAKLKEQSVSRVDYLNSCRDLAYLHFKNYFQCVVDKFCGFIKVDEHEKGGLYGLYTSDLTNLEKLKSLIKQDDQKIRRYDPRYRRAASILVAFESQQKHGQKPGISSALSAVSTKKKDG